MDFAVLADHRVKLKESKKKDKSLNLVIELKKLWNMKEIGIIIEICALGTATKGLLQDWRTWKWKDEWRPSKLQHYWDRPEYWAESLRLEETWCYSNSSERPTAYAGGKNYQGVK